MKSVSFFFLLSFLITLSACAQKKVPALQVDQLPEVITTASEYNELSKEAAYVILNQGTEPPFTGIYHDSKKEGVYLCKQCNKPLFRSSDKFDSGTGWPSFDDAINGGVKELPDADGSRTEIVCANCGGHLGHVFKNEGFTSKQTRHCANSLSLNFVSFEKEENKPQKRTKTGVYPVTEYIEENGLQALSQATFAGGCFWCTEAAFERINGVVDVISGYSGGKEEYPTYKSVSAGQSTHAEAVMVFYDPEVIDYKTLLLVFFTAHDPTQLNRQGPDVGTQYRSAIYFQNKEEQNLVLQTMKELKEAGAYSSKIVTQVEPYSEFWVAEEYHQNFYELNPNQRYIQGVSKPKVEKVMKVFADLLKEEYQKK